MARDDLTGAALVALMQFAFERQGIGWPGDRPAQTRAAHASLSDKERAAEMVLAVHGPKPLLRVGEYVGAFKADPVGAVLLSARDAPDLLARWQRLERYLHTRHPILIEVPEAGEAWLDHRGDPADPPSAAINLVLAGLFRGLLAAIGCEQVHLRIGTAEGPQLAIDFTEEAQLALALPAGLVTGLWHYRFTPPQGTAAEPAADVLSEHGRLARRVMSLIERDLVRRPSLSETAAAVGLSKRTMQRRLAEAGLDLQTMRREAQLRRAAAMLVAGAASLDAIGYSCGFADAAHFSRAFRQRAGLPPREYRALAKTDPLVTTRFVEGSKTPG